MDYSINLMNLLNLFQIWIIIHSFHHSYLNLPGVLQFKKFILLQAKIIELILLKFVRYPFNRSMASSFMRNKALRRINLSSLSAQQKISIQSHIIFSIHSSIFPSLPLGPFLNNRLGGFSLKLFISPFFLFYLI